jgi:hypothetical protein
MPDPVKPKDAASAQSPVESTPKPTAGKPPAPAVQPAPTPEPPSAPEPVIPLRDQVATRLTAILRADSYKERKSIANQILDLIPE